MTDQNGAKRSSATDELRRMLDERGVEWTPSVFDPQHETFYSTENGVGFIVTEFPEIQRMSLACDMRITPEQVISATLGRGECHDRGDPSDFCCSECGVRMFTNTSDTYTMIASDGRTIIKHPNFCPNCGRKVVDDG